MSEEQIDKRKAMQISDDEIKQFVERHIKEAQALRENPDAWAEELEERAAWGITLPPGHVLATPDEDRED